MSTKNILAIPVFSFVPPKYKELIKNHGGKLFLVILILCLIRTVLWGIKINNVFDEVFSSMPEFRLSNTELYIEKEYELDDSQMYFLISSDVDGISEKDFKEFAYNNNYSNIIILTKSNIAILSNNGVQVADYKQLKLCDAFGVKELNRDTIRELISPLIMFINVFLFFWFILSYYFACLFLWLLTLAACSIMKKTLTGGDQFKLTMIARMPVYIVTFLISLYTPVSIPWYIHAAAVFGLVLLGLRDNNSNVSDTDYTDYTYNEANIESGNYSDDIYSNTRDDKYNNNF